MFKRVEFVDHTGVGRVRKGSENEAERGVGRSTSDSAMGVAEERKAYNEVPIQCGGAYSPALAVESVCARLRNQEVIMKMVTIICREKFDSDVLALLNNLGIKGYTVMTGAGGSGQRCETGKHGWTDHNTLFLVALDDAQVATLVTGVKGLQVRLVAENSGVKVALKAFVQPCEEIL